MTFLKWYTFVMLLLSLLMNLYRCGKDDNTFEFIVILLMTTPILIYIFLS